MTPDDLTKLSEAELDELMVRGIEEKRLRKTRRRNEAIARIKEIASSEGLVISIRGLPGRPGNSTPAPHAKKKAGGNDKR